MHTDFMLSEATLRAIGEMGYEEATPIQAAAIPPLLDGRDVIGQAQTGTGKTAAFGIPIVEGLEADAPGVQALVLCPTRELALQVAGEIEKFGRYRRGLTVLPVYGGQPIERQLRGLRMGAQVVVGTPGRVMDHMRRGSLDLSGIKMAVLDEADEMLDMGFRDDIETILRATPDARQTALFSATMPRAIMHLARRYLKDPEHITIERREMTVESTQQMFIPVRSFHKAELLARLLLRDRLNLTLVFVATKRGVEDVVTELVRRGFSAAGLHGDMRQTERDAIMGRFRSGLVSILVATDVAARGLDVTNIDAVINYDVPQDVECYVHRVGRTGRAGREGCAYTFVVGSETMRIWEFRRVTGAKILCAQPPTAHELRQVRAEALMESLMAPEQTPTEDAFAMADQLIEALGERGAAAALCDALMGAAGAQIDESIDLTPPAPSARAAAPAKRPPRRVGPYGQPVHRGSASAHARPAATRRDGRYPARSKG